MDKCGICLEHIAVEHVQKTVCCQNLVCSHCAAADQAYKVIPSCPFCRHQHYETRPLHQCGEATVPSQPRTLEGTWEVQVKESSKIGSSSYSVTLEIGADSARYVVADDDCHYKDSSWNELNMGHTSSGKSFVARQKIAKAPSWLGDGVSVLGRAGLSGRLTGPNSAKFTSSMTLFSPGDDDELEIVQEGSMMRKSSPVGSKVQ